MNQTARPRPSPDLLRQLQEGKRRWRRAVAQKTFKEKIALLLAMQRRLHPVLRERGTLRWWEQPWEITP